MIENNNNNENIKYDKNERKKLFLYSSLLNHLNNNNNYDNNNNIESNICYCLKDYGYIILELDNLTNIQKELFYNYENIFSNIFLLDNEIKDNNISQFNSVKGYTLGYRRDGLREFIETRLQGDYNIVLPLINNNEFNEQVKEMWKILKEISKNILISMAITIGIDPFYFLQLIDPDILPEDEISSSILRICSYPFDTNHLKESQISFGAHTDTTFITIGAFSSTSGLEIQDKVTKEWISVEDINNENSNNENSNNNNNDNNPKVAIFVGDVMQLLTSGFYTATVHRVRTYHRHPHKNIQVPRVSCPFLVRGRHKSKVPSIYKCKRFPPLPPPPSLPSLSLSSTSTTLITTENYSNEIDQENQNDNNIIELADFEGMNMKLIHSILDLKRQKCMKENQKNEKEGDGYQSDEEKAWVLKAFP